MKPSPEDIKLLAEDYLNHVMYYHCPECSALIEEGFPHEKRCRYSNVRETAKTIAALPPKNSQSCE